MPPVSNTSVPPSFDSFVPQMPSNTSTFDPNSFVPQMPPVSNMSAPPQFVPQSYHQIPPASSVPESYSNPLKSEANPHAQLSSQSSAGSGINSSSYQQYLAYGAPPSTVSHPSYQQQFSPPASGNLKQ
jgi:hypothetical protein